MKQLLTYQTEKYFEDKVGQDFLVYSAGTGTFQVVKLLPRDTYHWFELSYALGKATSMPCRLLSELAGLKVTHERTGLTGNLNNMSVLFSYVGVNWERGPKWYEATKQHELKHVTFWSDVNYLNVV